jgi:GNAT superfamily N-acetyltransferase/RimJ/RimL family protein N-acetyltransferase
MELERFDPADDRDAVRACHEIYLSGLAADDPIGPPMSYRAFAGWLELGWTEDPQETWLARDGSGEACGWYVLGLPERENRRLAGLRVVVRAAQRRAGVGTALFRHGAARAQKAGRTQLDASAREGSPGSAFARALGARPGITEVRRVLDLETLPDGHLTRLRAKAEAAARGYELMSWDGPVPEDHLEDVAAINNDATADMPREPGQQAQRWNAERIRLDERRVAAQGLRSYTVAARSSATGELAGLTQLAVDPADPAWGFQELTAVARPHRGHRLGLLVKAAMLDRLAAREPQISRILTGNADDNKHMIAINAELGFGVLGNWLSWEIEVAQAVAPPGPLRAQP